MAGSFSQAIYALKKGEKGIHTRITLSPVIFHLYSYPTSPLQWRSMDCLLCQQDSFNKSGYMENPDTGHLEADSLACIRRSKFIPSVLYEDSQGDIWIGPPITVFYDILRRIINYLPYPALAAQRLQHRRRYAREPMDIHIIRIK